MHRFLDTADDVLALRIDDTITGADLEAIVDRLERRLARPGAVHVFVEARAIDGIDVSGLAAHGARAMPMLAQLGRFGRVAIVADQSWVRWGSRIESALLPFISYRVFEPEQREDALAWVRGTPEEASAPATR